MTTINIKNLTINISDGELTAKDIVKEIKRLLSDQTNTETATVNTEVKSDDDGDLLDNLKAMNDKKNELAGEIERVFKEKIHNTNVLGESLFNPNGVFVAMDKNGWVHAAKSTDNHGFDIEPETNENQWFPTPRDYSLVDAIEDDEKYEDVWHSVCLRIKTKRFGHGSGRFLFEVERVAV